MTEPKHRSQGVGQRMLALFEEQAFKNEVRRIILEVSIVRGRETYEAEDQAYPRRSLEGQTLVSDVNLQATACCIELVPMPFENQELSPEELRTAVFMLAKRSR